MKPDALQVLLIEDSAGDARLLREMFGREKAGNFELTHLTHMSEAEVHLSKHHADIILLDMGLPDGHGIDTLRRAHAMAPGTPLIVLTGMDDEALAAEAMKEGAQDYLIKNQIQTRALPRALRHAIERQHMQTENDRIRTHQLQFKDEFLSHVSHELRSPLNAIHQFVAILLDRLPGGSDAEERRLLEIVLRNAKQLQAMINDLFEVVGSRMGKLMIEPQPTSLADAIADTIDTLEGTATAKRITLSTDVVHPLPSAYADPMRLRQILIILVENAIKFTSAKGTVKIQARIFNRDPSALLLEVSDSGCGINQESIGRIFERLFQAENSNSTARKGLGLGLYICKELVARQGGQIWATSTPGQGAVFSVKLPIFSLFELLAPTLRKAASIDCATALLVTELGSETGWLSDQMRREHSFEVRNVLQQCLHSSLDVLLPRMGSAGGVELFFMVVATDELGAAAVARQIREQLNACTRIQQSALTHSTTFQPLEATKRNPNEPTEGYLKKVTIEIENLMNQELSRRL
jgi:signal transduction histidine kinase